MTQPDVGRSRNVIRCCVLAFNTANISERYPPDITESILGEDQVVQYVSEDGWPPIPSLDEFTYWRRDVDVVLPATPAENDMGEVIDEHIIVDSIDRLIQLVKLETANVQTQEREQYDTWWLVIHGELLTERGHFFEQEEMDRISLTIRSLEEARRWNNIVVLIGNTTYTLWEENAL